MRTSFGAILDRIDSVWSSIVVAFVAFTLVIWAIAFVASKGRRHRVLWYFMLVLAEPALAWGLLAANVWHLEQRGVPLLGSLMPMPVPVLIAAAMSVILVRAMRRGRISRDRTWRYFCYVVAFLGFYAPLPWSAYDARLAMAVGSLPILFAQILYLVDDDTYEWSHKWHI